MATKNQKNTKKQTDHDLLTSLSKQEDSLDASSTKLWKRWHWGLAFGIIATLILVIWSYLNFLCATTQLSDNKDANWLLSLFYGDRCNKQSGINLPSAGEREPQQLSFDSSTGQLTLSGGGGNVSLTIPDTSGPTGANGLNGLSGSSGAPGPTPPNCAPGTVLTFMGGAYSCVASGVVLSAQNGTSLVGTALELGLNPLLHDTNIFQSGYDMIFDGGVGGTFDQRTINSVSGEQHGIYSGENIFGAPINGSVLYSSPNPAMLPFGGAGAYNYALEGQSGLGANDGLGETSNFVFFPTGYNMSHNGLLGNSSINAGSNSVDFYAYEVLSGFSASAYFNNSPGTARLNGQGLGADYADFVADGGSAQARMYTQNSLGSTAYFALDANSNFSQWYSQDGIGGSISTQHNVATGMIENIIYSGLDNNYFQQIANTGLVFNSNNFPVYAPNIFAVSNFGDIDFDRELRPGGNAGNAGEVLISQGVGLPPIWGNGGFLVTADNGLSVNPANNVQLGGALIQDTDISSPAGVFDLTFDSAGAGGQFAVGCAPTAGKVATFCGDVNITGVIDPTALLFSDQTPSSYSPAVNNGYRIGVTGATQRPIFVSPMADNVRAFEVRNAANTGTILDVDTFNSRVGINTTAPMVGLEISGQSTNTEVVRFADGVDTVGQFVVNADPNGVISGARGSIAQDYTNGTAYINTDDATAWTNILTATGSCPPGGSFICQDGNSFGTAARFGSNDANSAIIETNGIDRLTIDTSGNVTQAGGQYRAPNGTAAAPAYSFSADTNSGMYSNGGDYLLFSTGGTERLRINSAGSVIVANGITALNPISAYGPGLASSGNFLNQVTADGRIEFATPAANTGIIFRGTGADAAYRADIWRTAGTSDLNFRVGAPPVTTYLNAMYIKGTTGHVGIGGLTNPVSRLNIEDTSAVNDTLNVFTIDRDVSIMPANGIGSSMLFRLDSALGGRTNAAELETVFEDASVGSQNSSLRFYTNIDGSFAERMRITDIGNFAIGATSATNRLQVTDTSDDTVASFTGLTQTCTVDTSGGGGWSCSSDARLKENIVDLEGGLDKLLALNAVSYNYRSNPNEQVAGFVAQEVEKILPGLVGVDSNGYKTLNKEGMIPYLVEAVKTQDGSIEKINQQLSTQGITLESLSEEVRGLSQQVQNIIIKLDQKEIGDKARDDEIKQLRERLKKLEDTQSIQSQTRE